MRIKKSFFAFVVMIGLTALFASCEDWGQMDPAAGTDVYPTRQKLETYSFNEDGLDEMAYVKSYNEGVSIVFDDSLYNQSLHLEGAQVQLVNPLTAVTLQNGAGFTFWLRAPEGQTTSNMLSLPDGTSLLPAAGIPNLEDGCPHFVGVQIRTTGYTIFMDGESVNATNDLDNVSLIAALNAAETIVVGSTNGEFWFDDFTAIRNQMTEKDYARPTIKKGAVKVPDPIYLNTFNSGVGDAEIIGAGSIRTDEDAHFGKVFQNVAGAKSTNYLLLPSHVLSHSATTQEMTIGFWVNAVNAGELNDYTYSPFMTAYASAPEGENGIPMFALQSRGPVQINNNGWSDFTGTNHVDGKVNIYHQNAWEAGDGAYNFVRNWLDDAQWHYYTITFKATQVTQYLDGQITNQWDFDPSIEGQQITGLFDNGGDYKYIVLGGNQAWGWGDPDAGFAFDDFVVYDQALSQSQVQRIIDIKNGVASDDEGDDFEYIEYVDGSAPMMTVGPTDCSAAWWAHFSDYYRIPAGATMHLRLKNHTSGGGNWNNWVLALTTDDVRGGGNYAEYEVLRSDLWGWGDSYTGAWENEGYGDWDQFRADMEGAIVDITIKRTGKNVLVDAVSTAPNGTVYHEWINADCGDGNQVIRAFLVCDGSYYEMQTDGCYVESAVDVETVTVGPTDCSAAWWAHFSDYFSIGAEKSLHLGLTNHTSGGGNWNNWVLAVTTDDERGGGNYAEYEVLRSDLWGWGDAYTGAWENEGYGDWDQFRIDMEGAYVDLDIERAGSLVKVTGTSTATNGTVYKEWITATCGDGKQTIRVFIVCDGSYYVMNPSDCYLKLPIY